MIGTALHHEYFNFFILYFLIIPVYFYVCILLILVKDALTFVHAVKCRRRGKHALVCLHLRRLRTPLPGIFLSKVRLLCRKLDEL